MKTMTFKDAQFVVSIFLAVFDGTEELGNVYDWASDFAKNGLEHAKSVNRYRRLVEDHES